MVMIYCASHVSYWWLKNIKIPDDAYVFIIIIFFMKNGLNLWKLQNFQQWKSQEINDSLSNATVHTLCSIIIQKMNYKANKIDDHYFLYLKSPYRILTCLLYKKTTTSKYSSKEKCAHSFTVYSSLFLLWAFHECSPLAMSRWSMGDCWQCWHIIQQQHKRANKSFSPGAQN